MEELWLPAKGHESFLIVSTYGNVIRKAKEQKHWQGGISTRKETMCKTSLTCKKRGYKQVKYGSNYIRKSVLVHRLVAETFIPLIDGKDFINHKDGNKLNNNITNLEWCTLKENAIHSVKTGLWRKGTRVKPMPFGFSNERNKPVTLIVDGLGFITFANAKYASIYINVSTFTHIGDVCIGKRKTAYGYSWEYAKKF
jgi:hypothetical protein